MSLHESVHKYAFAVRRKSCGCTVAVSTLDPYAAGDLFSSYKRDKEYEIAVIPIEEERIRWGPCPHVAVEVLP